MVSQPNPMVSQQEWSELNFGTCELGDKRRTRRLVQVATGAVNNPSASLTDQTASWSDTKAAYNLFDREEVTFEAVAKPHWNLTRQRPTADPDRYLIIGDTTEIDFGIRRQIEGLGQTGNGTGRGFLLHNALMVKAASKEIVGLAGQTIHYRALTKKSKRAKKKESSAAKLRRKRESEVWGKVVNDIGPPPPGAEYVHVFDRGADNYEVFHHLDRQSCGWVVRAGRLNRKVLAGPHAEFMKLNEYLQKLTVMGKYPLELRARPQQAARTAQLEVRAGTINVPVPRHCSPWVRKAKPLPIAMNVVYVVEVNPPEDVEPISWVLLTTLPVTTFDETEVVVEYYETRWLIEEYHKSLKTGCRVECRQLKTAGRLEAMLGMMSVVALTLIQWKSLARTTPDIPAKKVVPAVWLQMLKAARKNLQRVHDLTIGQFYREVAKLGGFLGRKSDGEPGWITIWRGMAKLNAYVHGATLAMRQNMVL